MSKKKTVHFLRPNLFCPLSHGCSIHLMHNNPEHSKTGRRAVVDTSICAPSPRLLNFVEVHCYSVVSGYMRAPTYPGANTKRWIPPSCLYSVTWTVWSKVSFRCHSDWVKAPDYQPANASPSIGPKGGKKRQSVQCKWQFTTVTQSLKDEWSTLLGVMLTLELPFPAPGQNGNGVFVENWGHSCYVCVLGGASRHVAFIKSSLLSKGLSQKQQISFQE